MRAIAAPIFITTLSLISGISQAADTVNRTLTLDAAGLEALEVKAGAGSLDIQGVRGAETITVEAVIQADLDDVILSLEKRGDKAVLTSEIDDKVRISWGWNNSPKIDLKVTLPQSLLLAVNDGSGDMSVRDMENDVDINDGSGSLEIENIGGNLDLIDGSGDLRIESVAGNISINDGSGGVRIVRVGGSVEGNDGSGDFSAEHVTGGIQLTDGSGNLRLQDIGGSIDLNDGSGDISIENIVGDISIVDGSGTIRVKTVDGHVEIHDGSGDIIVAGVTRGLKVGESGSGAVRTDNIQGDLIIDD